jgi:hypothetical protein
MAHLPLPPRPPSPPRFPPWLRCGRGPSDGSAFVAAASAFSWRGGGTTAGAAAPSPEGTMAGPVAGGGGVWRFGRSGPGPAASSRGGGGPRSRLQGGGRRSRVEQEQGGGRSRVEAPGSGARDWLLRLLASRQCSPGRYTHCTHCTH